jgi:hypothetical protein
MKIPRSKIIGIFGGSVHNISGDGTFSGTSSKLDPQIMDVLPRGKLGMGRAFQFKAQPFGSALLFSPSADRRY